MATVELEQHPFLRHPLPSHPVAWLTPVPGTRQSCIYQEPANGRAGQHQPLALRQQFRQMCVVEPAVALAGHGHDLLPDDSWGHIRRYAPPVPMGQHDSPLLSVGCQ